MEDNKIEVEQDLSRPSVQVKVPDVRLRLEDLAYLRSLTQPETVRCFPKASVLNRLRFLDLIARANVPPTDKVVEEVKEVEEKQVDILRAAVDTKNWRVAGDCIYKLTANQDRLRPRAQDIITPKGKEVLRAGQATIKVRKVGCL